MSIRTTGVREVIAALGKVSPRVRKAANRVVVGAGLKVQAEAKANTPVDSGRLRNSISIADNEAGLVEGVPVAISPDTLSLVVGTNVEYALPVHNGTSRMAGRPFLFNAWEAERAVLAANLRSAVRKELGL